MDQLSVGDNPLLIYDVAAAAKTISVLIQARSGYPKAILVNPFGHSLSQGASQIRCAHAVRIKSANLDNHRFTWLNPMT